MRIFSLIVLSCQSCVNIMKRIVIVSIFCAINTNHLISLIIGLDYRMDQTSIDYSLYIPRVALSSSSSSSKSSSRFKQHSALKRPTATGDISETSGESESEGIYGSSVQNYDGLRPNRHRMYFVHKAKRGSHSTNSSSSSSLTSNNVRFFLSKLINL